LHSDFVQGQTDSGVSSISLTIPGKLGCPDKKKRKENISLKLSWGCNTLVEHVTRNSKTEGSNPPAERQRGREAEGQRGRGAERQRGRETERRRDRETERQRDRDTETQRDTETERRHLILMVSVTITYIIPSIRPIC
jgi:hypothetical protein